MAAADDDGGLAFAEEDYSDSYDVIEGLLSVNPDMDPHKYPRRQIAVRSATHKYIWCDDRLGEFYNLVEDPNEEHNLIETATGAERGVLRQLQAAMEAWLSGLEIFTPRTVEELQKMDQAVIERPRSLGYIS